MTLAPKATPCLQAAGRALVDQGFQALDATARSACTSLVAELPVMFGFWADRLILGAAGKPSRLLHFVIFAPFFHSSPLLPFIASHPFVAFLSPVAPPYLSVTFGSMSM